MSTDLSIAGQADASTFDFTDAEISALLARQDFADTKEKHDAQTALKLFNRQGDCLGAVPAVSSGMIDEYHRAA